MCNNQKDYCIKDNYKHQRSLSLQWRHDIERKVYNFVLKAQYNNDARRVVEYLCNKAYEEVQKLLEDSMQEQPSQPIVSGTEIMVLDPNKSVTNGRKKRIKGSML